MISLRVDTATFSLKDTLGAMHGGEPNTDGFNFLFLPFNDLVNIEYLFGNYSVSTGGSGVWFSATGTASTVLGNQITPIPLPAPLAAFLCCGAVVGIRRRR